MENKYLEEKEARENSEVLILTLKRRIAELSQQQQQQCNQQQVSQQQTQMQNNATNTNASMCKSNSNGTIGSINSSGNSVTSFTNNSSNPSNLNYERPMAFVQQSVEKEVE